MTLFGTLPEQAEWTRHDPTNGRGKGASYTHKSGWVVQHCGHPTATFPYYLVDPAHPNAVTMTHNGRGWGRLDAAKAAVRDILDGTMVTTDENCVTGVRVVVSAHATGARQ